MLSQNARMQERMECGSARGGRALSKGVVRCGRCGRVTRSSTRCSQEMPTDTGAAATLQCKRRHGASALAGSIRVDRAIAEAVSVHATEAAMRAAELAENRSLDRCQAISRESRLRNRTQVAIRTFVIPKPSRLYAS
jgi:hypothetical protein